MTLLVTTDSLLERRHTVVRAPFAELAHGLRSELAPLIDHLVEVPREKALLSRKGGRCEIDGALLIFDPLDARHTCPTCGREYHGELHNRFRLYWYQLWLAERVLHGALLGALTDDVAARALAVQLLEQYAEEYLRYPNADNVLGPSRPFFSTYLESIWVLQLTIALSILETTPSAETASLGARVRERVILPSAMLIASYDEGMSNRQVWNNAALMAAGRMLGNVAMVERAIHGPSGLHAHLTTALLEDGTWYEGENYHLFAHRGLWYGENLARMAGETLPPALEHRYREGFVAPFRTILPDLTYPSRRDSQYAVSIRQPRFAESCELGLVYGDDARLAGILARLYDGSVPRAETGRRTSSADVERNVSATGLQRADLSWRTLLCAREVLPLLTPLPLQSDLLPAQGIGVIRRRGGDLYVSLDYGHSGGGHGHPDRLNFTLMDHTTRWFDDPGTGSYVDPTLHWYRSTLAHNAPIVDGRSQARVHGTLVAFEDDGQRGRIEARASLAPGLVVSRRIVVLDDYLIDALTWQADEPHAVALPMHGAEPIAERTREPDVLLGRDGIEDGFNFLDDVARVIVPTSSRLTFQSTSSDGRTLAGWTFLSRDATAWTATAPSPPGLSGPRALTLLEETSRSGSFVSVWCWAASITDVTRDDNALIIARTDGTFEAHAWENVAPSVPDTHDASQPVARADSSARGSSTVSEQSFPARYVLAEDHYRRSELTWSEAGTPSATVTISLVERKTVLVAIEVMVSHRHFIPLDVENIFDNEPASINGDSVQLYAATSQSGAGLLLVPDGPDVAARPIDGWLNDLRVTAAWAPTSTGYSLLARLDVGEDATELDLDIIINLSAPDRARRQGQLVLSGANGEFVYLRGDRHDRPRLLRFLLPR